MKNKIKQDAVTHLVIQSWSDQMRASESLQFVASLIKAADQIGLWNNNLYSVDFSKQGNNWDHKTMPCKILTHQILIMIFSHY